MRANRSQLGQKEMQSTHYVIDAYRPVYQILALANELADALAPEATSLLALEFSTNAALGACAAFIADAAVLSSTRSLETADLDSRARANHEGAVAYAERRYCRSLAHVVAMLGGLGDPRDSESGVNA